MIRKEIYEDTLEWKGLNKTADQSDHTTWRDKSKCIGERSDLKDIENGQKYNRNNKKKFYQAVGGECTRTYQLPDVKKAKQFWGKI